MKKIGQILVERGDLTKDQLEEMLDDQENREGQLLGQIGIEMGFLKEEQLRDALSVQFDMPVFEFGDITLPPEVLQTVTDTMAQLYRVVPISFKEHEGVLTIATANPQNIQTVDELRTFLGYDIRTVITTEADIKEAIERYYAEDDNLEKLMEDMNNDEELAALAGKKGKFSIDDELAAADSAPVRKLLNMVLLLAIKDHASDIHFEPFETDFKIRVKADGVLFEMVPPPRHLALALVTRIKVMANLDIAERRLPQDGRIELSVGGHPVDLRVAVCPTMFGESVVIRILDRSVVNLDLEAVGMNTQTMEQFRQIIKRPNGIVLVTGPTGSGKTTTLYSSLCELNTVHDKIITTEDPVEYDIDGIVQVPIDPSIDITFASCLRAILRQDPDIILVGEIRDSETAEIAIQASLTGHLVFSTLHTNDAPSTITRLRDMHIPPFLITATVEAILAQRLLRRICTNCKQLYVPRSELLVDLGLKPDDMQNHKFYRGAGCEKCNNSGNKGRIGIFELMVMNDTLREMVMQNASVDEMRETAKGFGMVPLRDAGLQMIFEGVTTPEEVIRETVID